MHIYRIGALARTRPGQLLERAACRGLVLGLATLLLGGAARPALGSLETYDATIALDAAGGLAPVARLETAVVLTGANRAAFNFGANSGAVTMEFILEGNPAAIPTSGYLAVGANSTSNLRYEAHNNTGQLGFTQLGVADYLFSPAVASPTTPTHVTYAWNPATLTMKLYLNGFLAGTRSGVNANFAMPTGQGWLGANPNNTENMVGTIYRVTVYDDLVAEEVIRNHADAFRGIVRPPVLVSFTAQPPVVFTPGSSTLRWDVRQATAVFLDGTDVTARSNLVVTPETTTTYTLVATNAGGSVTGQVTVLVNPAPIIHRFAANRTYVAAGDTITLSWNASYGETFSISPGVGDVTGLTLNGAGSIAVQAPAPLTYHLVVANEFGLSSAELEIHRVFPAGHLVISEFMADDDATLADEDGEHSGWIEIHNPTGAPLNLAGHFLTDEADEPMKWALPARELAAGGYLVVFASGKNRVGPAGPLHTNFRLNNQGEYLALIGPGPVLLHAFAPAYPPQRRDLSYGLLGGDPATARYLGVPTPGAANDETPPPPAPVRISVPSRVFTEPFAVTLSALEPEAEVRFTLDGSIPSPTHGARYTAPIQITTTTRLRAVAVAGGQAGRLAGASYIKLAPELVGYTSSLPLMVIENFGAGVIQQKGWNSSGAGLKQVPRQPAAWVTFERQGGVSAFTQAPDMFALVGIRGRGAYSTEWRQKPYSVEAMDEHGQEAEVSPLGLPPHADWVLYFPDPDQNKDPTLLFNTFAYELSKDLGHYAVRFRWVEAFINEDGGELRLADRRGVYALIEKVARGKHRLDFQRLAPDGSTGGWLLNINRMDPEPENGWPAPNGAVQPWFFRTAGANRILETQPNTLYTTVPGDDQPRQWNGMINFDNPNGYVIHTNQRLAIEGWFKQFEDVLYNNALWRNPVLGYRKYLDLPDFVDYFILNNLTRNGDGLLISIFPWKGDDGKLRIGPAWDYNWNPYYVSGAPTTTPWHRADRLWYGRLFSDPDFLQLYIDRWWNARRGPMSNAALEAIVDRQAAEIGPDKALLNGLPSASEWSNRLATMKSWLTQRADWLDSFFLRPPVFSQDGGPVPEGFPVIITGTNGTIYFTTDGTDPRAPGGAVAAGAQAYQLPVVIQTQTLLQARLKNGTNWSGLTAAVFYPPQDLTKLVVTEIMYHPPAFGPWPSEDLEFLELKNTGTNTLNLGNLVFTSGISFVFSNGTRLEPGGFFVLVRNLAAFQSKYPGVTAHGVYSGRLDNAGETLRLATPLGATVFDLTYNDRAPWPLAADGHGFSVVPRHAAGPPNSDQGAHWRASAALGGSPGADDPEPAGPTVLINEVLTHTEPPAVDAVELFNPAPVSVHLGGWFLSDDGAVPKKFRIPDGTLIAAGGYLVFTEADFNPQPGTLLNFALDSAGDALYLSAADAAGNLTGYGHGVDFGAAAPGVSFGRYVNSVGEEHFPAQRATTLGAANAGPAVGPVVITEIMYHPDATGDEFLELRNVTDQPVLLFDQAQPTNTWRVNGLGYRFPTNVVLPPHAVLVIAATPPDAFRAKYALSDTVAVLGPFAGVLQDNGERLELQRPAMLGTNGWAYITVDEVRYDDKAPWPAAADGGGPSLQRRTPAAYGNDPANWVAATPTPGADLLLGQPPVILAAPSARTVALGQTVTFSVSVAGAPPLLFQWLWNGRPITGATNATLELASVQAGDAGDYAVAAYNAFGSVISPPARLEVRTPPLILQAPTNVVLRIRPDPLAAPATNAYFHVAAYSAYPLRYQWFFNGTPLPSATNAALTLTNVQPEHWGEYTVAVSDEVGTVAPPPVWLQPLIRPGFAVHPASQSVAAGSLVSLSAVATGWPPPFTMEWRRAATPVVTNVQTSLATFLSFPAPSVVTTVQYRAVLKNLASPAGVGSAFATITVQPDTDGDGLPDPWEADFGFNPLDAADALQDADGDGLSNWAEHAAGTDPTNAASFLKIEAAPDSTGAWIILGAQSNKTYTVQFTDTLATQPWARLADVAALPTNRLERLRDSGFRPQRFYRVVTPRQPD